MKILIAGDSFAAPWPNCDSSWTSLLAENNLVVNVAQAGVSEYKIYKQLLSQPLTEFDCVIVSHTSPSRVHTRKHPIHNTGLHKNCDLIFTDIEAHSSWFNVSLRTAKNWFKYHYDDEYQSTVYKLVREEINRIIPVRYLSIDNLNITDDLIIEKEHLDLRNFWVNYKGEVNHYSAEGHAKIFKMITQKINL